MKDLSLGLVIVIVTITACILTFASHMICGPGRIDTVGCYVCQDGRTVKYSGIDGFLPRRKAMTQYECTPVDIIPKCKSKMELRL